MCKAFCYPGFDSLSEYFRFNSVTFFSAIFSVASLKWRKFSPLWYDNSKLQRALRLPVTRQPDIMHRQVRRIPPLIAQFLPVFLYVACSACRNSVCNSSAWPDSPMCGAVSQHCMMKHCFLPYCLIRCKWRNGIQHIRQISTNKMTKVVYSSWRWVTLKQIIKSIK